LIDDTQFGMMMNSTRFLVCLALLFGTVPMTSCVPLVAGAAAGYVASEEGYRVRSPITKEKDKD